MEYQPLHVSEAAEATFKHFPLGDTAMVLQFGEQISPEVHLKIQAFAALLEKNTLAGIVEWVPAYTTLTIYYAPLLIGNGGSEDPYDVLYRHLASLAAKLENIAPMPGRLVEIPVCYGGSFGPDLDIVAAHHNISPEEVIAIHSQQEYTVYMIGFAPGFPYLGGLSKKIACPRKAAPRSSVPAGSVGIAGLQTGIYPISTPGGWQLIGRTPITLFGYCKQPPSLLQAGDRLRFMPVSAKDYERMERSRHEH
ncbi:5-oxoprolinase subunit PxpB [Cesiribacter sp. SM1]|uniref:5-oxoprolinase subunit PxpB n=1 Tax=Cesiribacter sp. SM1 TaxID=2861196 RepID=UPI001CD7DD42|nr:5-oxoprolinase subunit PxpB [Cesiribacter sp. SM1]